MADDTTADESADVAICFSGYAVALRIDRLTDKAGWTRVDVDCVASLGQNETGTKMIFEGAIEKQVGNPGAYQWSDLRITSIRDWGWDRVAFALEDTETG
jgi:hypothetical protein